MDLPMEDLQSLIDLGLTLVQAKVFLTLTQTGTISVKTISQASKVARPDVYRALSKLHELGLIEKEIARPVLFSAIPTEDALAILMESQTWKYKELQSKTANLVHKYKKRNENLLLSKYQFVFIPSNEALIKRLKTAIDNAQKSIDVATSCKRLLSAGYRLSENLQNAWDRGIKGRVVTDSIEEIQCESIKEFWRAPRAEIRYIPTVPRTVMAMYDKRELFVFTKPTAQITESPALWSNVPNLVAMADDYFRMLWGTAMETSEYHLDSTKA